MSFRLALITGATGGLAAALCERLAREKIPLLLSGRDAEKLNALGRKFHAETIVADLAYDREPLLRKIQERSPDLVINNAGMTYYGECLAHRKKQREIIEVNGMAVFELTLAAAHQLKEHKKQGVILNVSSAAGELSFPGMATYAAAKAFVTSFSKSLDAEMRSFGIRVLAALPGQIETSFATRASGKKQGKHFLAMDPAYVAGKIWKQITERKALTVIDWRTRALLTIAKWFPRRMIEEYLFREIRRRLGS